MIAGPECFRSAVSGHRDLAAQNHDPHVELAVRMHILGDTGLLAAMHDFKALAAQVALKRFSGERTAIATAAGHVGDALGADMFGMHAIGGHLTDCPARKVSERLSRVMVISPPRTKRLASKSWQ